MDRYALVMYNWALRRRFPVQLSGELDDGKAIGSLKVALLGDVGVALEVALYCWDGRGSVLEVRAADDFPNILGTMVRNPKNVRDFHKALVRLGYGS